MSSSFKVFRSAALNVQLGWTQREYRHGEEVCTLQAIADVVGVYSVRAIPEALLNELDRELSKYKSYRLFRLLKDDRVNAMMAWNDAPWRLKTDVVDALNAVADRLELQWLRAEHARMSTEIGTLKARITELENENSRLRRLTNASTLRADRKQLENLERELAVTWENLQKQPALA